MAISQRLDVKQGQNLALTPQMRQAIELLQMSTIDLMAEVEKVVESNALLEREGADAPAEGGENEGGDEKAEEDYDDSYEAIDSDDMASGDALDASYEDLYDGDQLSLSWQAGGSSYEGERDDAWESRIADQPNLRDHLEAQLRLEVQDPAMRMMGLYLIDSLDENGWLLLTEGDIASRFGCEPEKVGELLQILRGFDPVGIFARSLSDCLALQLKEKDRLDSAMQTFLAHLALLGEGEYEKLVAVCGGDMEDLEEMIEEIRALDPKPAGTFDHVLAETLIPDLIMRRSGQEWIIEPNPESMPKLLLKHDYHSRVSRQINDKQERSWLSQQWQEANWLVRALQQRMDTMVKVSTEIVRHQQAFFSKGISALRPLVLREIAELVEMHESTISRVCNGKFIHTPRGIFELRYFFSNALQSSSGEQLSAESVRHRIRGLIESEKDGQIYSDDKIAEILEEENINVSRRTVAKYREAMRIPSSVMRRKQQKNPFPIKK